MIEKIWKKGQKKGQVTVFIIVAIVIALSLIIFFSVRGGLFKGEKVNPEIAGIHSFVEECVKEVGEDAVYQIGQTGGYALYADESTKNGIAYYFDKGRKLIPSKEQIEKELAKYVNEQLSFCINDFEDFPDFDISERSIDSKAKIVKGKIIFSVNYQLSITKGENTYVLEDFGVEVSSKLNTIYLVASEIIAEQMLDYENICINCISDIAFENKVLVSMGDEGNDVIIFSIIDEKYKIKDKDYWFSFASRYDLG